MINYVVINGIATALNVQDDEPYRHSLSVVGGSGRILREACFSTPEEAIKAYKAKLQLEYSQIQEMHSARRKVLEDQISDSKIKEAQLLQDLTTRMENLK